jgi:hypothetical protein
MQLVEVLIRALGVHRRLPFGAAQAHKGEFGSGLSLVQTGLPMRIELRCY